MSLSKQEQTIDELHVTLCEDWYAAEDYGEDKFTEMMSESITEELHRQRIKTFEATCYYVIQQLMYGEVGKEILQKICEVRGDVI